MKMYMVSYNGKDDEWFDTPGEAYISMLKFLQDYYNEDTTIAVRQIQKLNKSFNSFDDVWFGVFGVADCSCIKTEEVKTLEKVAAPAQGMTKEQAIKWIGRLMKRQVKISRQLDNLYNLLGNGVYDFFGKIDSFSIAISILEEAIGDKFGNIHFLFLECDGDIQKFGQQISVDDEPLNITTLEEFVDYIWEDNSWKS